MLLVFGFSNNSIADDDDIPQDVGLCMVRDFYTMQHQNQTYARAQPTFCLIYFEYMTISFLAGELK